MCFCFFYQFRVFRILLARALKKSSSAEGDSDVVNTYSRISKAILNTPVRAIQRIKKILVAVK